MKNTKNTKTVSGWILCVILCSTMISIFALILAYAKLDCPLNELDASFDRAITIVEMIIGALSLCATIYFVTMGITLHDYKKKLDETLNRAEKINLTMHFQLKETIAVFSAIESIAGDQEIIIRLAKGRLLCQSKYSDNEEKKAGIRYIQGYYMSGNAIRSTLSEDIEILEQLKNNPELNEEIRNSAQLALDTIQFKPTQEEIPKYPSKLITRLMNYIKRMVFITKKSGNKQ